MSPAVQTFVALAIVALAAGALLWRTLRRDPVKGCGSNGACGAVSPEVRKLRARLKSP